MPAAQTPSPSHTPVLEALSVSKTYPGGVQALSRVDLALEQGQTVALVGESGSGKTRS